MSRDVDQQAFTAALLDPGAAVPPGLRDPRGRPAGKRFDVYRNNVIVSLIDALEDGFPVIARLIGPDNFRNLARLFAREHPPSTPLLMFYGEAFPEFLEGFAPLSHLPYLGDVARLELARRAAYHARDSRAMSPADLAAIAPDRLMDTRFCLSPAHRIVSSRYPIGSIWWFNMEDGAQKPRPGGETVLISRPAYDPDLTLIDPATHAFLRAIAAGGTLETAHDAAIGTAPEFDLSAALTLVLGAGLFTTSLN